MGGYRYGQFFKISKSLALTFVVFSTGCDQNKPVFIKARIARVNLSGDFRETVLARDPADLPAQLIPLVPPESWADSFWLYSDKSVTMAYYHPGSAVAFLVVEGGSEGELLRIPQMDIRAIRSVSR
jgi:hypothetical protein